MPSAVPSVIPSGFAGPSLLTADVLADGSATDTFTKRAGVNADPNHPNTPVHITVRILVALQQPDGSLLYTPQAFLLLLFPSIADLEAAAQAMGLTPALYFNAAMLLKFEATRSGDEGEAERLLLRQYVTAQMSSESLLRLAAWLSL